MGKQYSRYFSLLGMRIQLISNYKDILYDDEYFFGKNAGLHSLLSNFHELISFMPDKSDHIDVRILIENKSGINFTMSNNNDTYIFSGPVKEMEEGSTDKRVSIFGNMGIFSKILVHELEKKGIFSFHSTSFIDPATSKFFLVLGSSGAGKSTVLLKAVKEGMQVFGTELTHFSIRERKVVFLKGSLWQNCRMGNLVEDFPSLLKIFSITGIPEGNPWQQYLSVNLKNWQYPEDIIENPEVIILFPRIESDRKKAERIKIHKGNIVYSLFENLSDKVSPPSYLYKKVFIPTVDDKYGQIKRMESAEKFIEFANIGFCWKFLAAPKDCLDEII